MDSGMQRVQGRHVWGGDVVLSDDQEVCVAVLVKITKCEGAVQIRADEIVSGQIPHAFDEIDEHGVERGVGRRR